MTGSSNGHPESMKIGFGTSLHNFSYVPETDITAWESTQTMVFLMHLMMSQVVKMTGPAKDDLVSFRHWTKVCCQVELQVENAWKRLDPNVARHFRAEEIEKVAEVKRPGLILPGGRG
ncbi:MAG: hypothetical protein V1755_06475 [Chloroflexota bacterium]